MEIIYLIAFGIIAMILALLSYKAGQKIGMIQRDNFWEKELPRFKQEAIAKSRAVIGGQFSEQLAPYLPDFKYLPTECRFLGKPIDLIVFKGMDEKSIDEIIFVEIKSGDSKLSAHEKNLKDAILAKKVKWEEYRIPKDLTKK